MTASARSATRAARALLSALASATSSGSPRSSSAASTGRASKRTPKRRSRAWRCGDAEARISGRRTLGGGVIDAPPATRLALGKEKRNLALGRARRVRAVHHVASDLERVIAADRSGRGLERVGRANPPPRRLHRLAALEHHGDDRPRDYEVDELAKERALGVLGVVLLGELSAHGHAPQGGDRQPLALEPRDDLAGQSAREGVRLDEDQGSLRRCLCHARVVYDPGRVRGPERPGRAARAELPAPSEAGSAAAREPSLSPSEGDAEPAGVRWSRSARASSTRRPPSVAGIPSPGRSECTCGARRRRGRRDAAGGTSVSQ